MKKSSIVYLTAIAGMAITAAAPLGVPNGAPADWNASVRASGVTAKPHEPGSSPVVSGHRGSPRLAPEETLASYRQALKEGTDVVEGDVQLTKDGVPVLVHDDTFARTTNVEEVFPDREPWNVGDFTLAEMKQLDAGSWFRPDFSSETVPTVAELLDIAAGRVGLSLEIKAPQNSPGVAGLLAVELARYGLDDDSRTRSGAFKIHVHSRDEATLREFNESLPEIPLAVLTGGVMLDDATLASLSGWTTGVFSDPRRTTAADIERANAHDLEVYSDPVDSQTQVLMAVNQGYEWIVTNQPYMARQVRDGRDPFRDRNGVVIDHVFQDAPGDDVQPENGEHVTLRNTTDKPIDVGGDYLRDQASALLTIGDGYVIQPGSLLRVYVGPGTNRPDAYYNGYTTGFLNNGTGDTLTYYEEDHAIVDVFSYIVP